MGILTYIVCTQWERGSPFTAFPSPLPTGRIFLWGHEAKVIHTPEVIFSLPFFLILNSFLKEMAGGLGSIIQELACIHGTCVIGGTMVWGVGNGILASEMKKWMREMAQ